MRNEGEHGGGAIDGRIRSVCVCEVAQNTTSLQTGTRLVTKACCLEVSLDSPSLLTDFKNISPGFLRSVGCQKNKTKMADNCLLHYAANDSTQETVVVLQSCTNYQMRQNGICAKIGLETLADHLAAWLLYHARANRNVKRFYEAHVPFWHKHRGV